MDCPFYPNPAYLDPPFIRFSENFPPPYYLDPPFIRHQRVKITEKNRMVKMLTNHNKPLLKPDSYQIGAQIKLQISNKHLKVNSVVYPNS